MTLPIDTDRLILRRFRQDDAPDVFAYLHEPGAPCFASMKLRDLEAATPATAKRVASEVFIAIEHRQSGRVIGEIFGHIEQTDTYSVAWQLNAEFAGQGLAHEAAKAFYEHLFHARDIRRVYAYVETDNPASQKLCLRLDMRLEGTFQEFISFEKDADGNPIYVDTQQYAILKREWLALSL